MMKILPADVSFVEYLDLSGSLGAAFRDEIFESTKEFLGQDSWRLRGLGECRFQSYYDNATGQSQMLKLNVYEGDFNRASLTRMMEAEHGPANQYGSILVWTWGDTGASLSLIDHFIIVGTTERVQQCIEATQDERESLYDNQDAIDVLNRLPKDFGFFLMTAPITGQDEPGCLATASTFAPVAGDFTSTSVAKYIDVDSATAHVSKSQTEHEGDATGFKISQDGVFVTSTFITNFD